MKTIEEIALSCIPRDAHNYIEHATSKEAFLAYAKELLATLRREAEPVARTIGTDWISTGEGTWLGLIESHLPLKDMTSLFTIPLLQVQAVPDGWKLVPIEPTEQMCSAATADSCWENMNPPPVTCYRAMLAASPLPPKGE